MADEITITAGLKASKGGVDINERTVLKVDMSGEDMIVATQEIGTSSETLGVGEITGTPAAVYVKNLDDTNFVDIGGDSGLTVFTIRVNPGQAVVFTPTSATIYAKADTAAVRVIRGLVEA